MVDSAAIDNDILVKCACFDLLSELATALGSPAVLGILGAARYVVRTALGRGNVRDNAAAERRFLAFLEHVTVLEPRSDEVALSAEIEEAALRAGVPLDPGESQLCAIVLLRPLDLLVTGDKRAVAAAESLQASVPPIRALAGRVVCLEQVLIVLLKSGSYSTVAARVECEPAVDKAVALCFRRSGANSEAESLFGLESYVSHLRSLAPSMLNDGSVLPLGT